MIAMKEIICACGCGRKKTVRVVDLARGWGKYFSKSCKAIHQTKTHPYNAETKTSQSKGKKGKTKNGYSHLSIAEQRKRLEALLESGKISYLYYLKQLPNRTSFEESEYNDEVFDSETHPFSSDALGQW